MASFFSYWHHAIGSKWGLNRSLLEYVEFGALGLVSIISPSSEIEIMNRFFCWIPYSLKNSMRTFENFLSTGLTCWELAHPVQWISVEVHYSTRFKFGAPELVLVISPSFGVEIMQRFFFFFFFGFLNLKGKFYQIFNFFLNCLNLLGTGSARSLCQLVWSTDFGEFGAQILLGSSP